MFPQVRNEHLQTLNRITAMAQRDITIHANVVAELPRVMVVIGREGVADLLRAPAAAAQRPDRSGTQAGFPVALANLSRADILGARVGLAGLDGAHLRAMSGIPRVTWTSSNSSLWHHDPPQTYPHPPVQPGFF